MSLSGISLFSVFLSRYAVTEIHTALEVLFYVLAQNQSHLTINSTNVYWAPIMYVAGSLLGIGDNMNKTIRSTCFPRACLHFRVKNQKTHSLWSAMKKKIELSFSESKYILWGRHASGNPTKLPIYVVNTMSEDTHQNFPFKPSLSLISQTVGFWHGILNPARIYYSNFLHTYIHFWIHIISLLSQYQYISEMILYNARQMSVRAQDCRTSNFSKQLFLENIHHPICFGDGC